MGNATSANEVHPLALSILEFANFTERGHVFFLSKKWHEFLCSDVAVRWMCYRLIVENKIYSPLQLSAGMSWKKLFLEMWKIRHLWRPEHSSCIGESDSCVSNITVYARFRPIESTENIKEAKSITLPLHQRLALIKMSGGFKSNRAALHVLKQEGSWFGGKWEELSRKENLSMNESSRHDAKKKTAAPLVANIQSVDAGSGRVVIMTPDVGLREFSFDGVLPAACDQQSVYDTVASRLVTDVMNGVNSTAIMYGQTGSG